MFFATVWRHLGRFERRGAGDLPPCLLGGTIATATPRVWRSRCARILQRQVRLWCRSQFTGYTGPATSAERGYYARATFGEIRRSGPAVCGGRNQRGTSRRDCRDRDASDQQRSDTIDGSEVYRPYGIDRCIVRVE